MATDDDHGRLIKVTHTWERIVADKDAEILRLKNEVDWRRDEFRGAVFNCETLQEQRNRAEAEVARLRGALQALYDATAETGVQSRSAFLSARVAAGEALGAAVSAGTDTDE